MEMLGYKVADIVETATLLLDVWLHYYDGKATIEAKGLFQVSKYEIQTLNATLILTQIKDVIKEYEKHEINMNNDLQVHVQKSCSQ